MFRILLKHQVHPADTTVNTVFKKEKVPMEGVCLLVHYKNYTIYWSSQLARKCTGRIVLSNTFFH